MKKTITIYELLGIVKDNKDIDIYVKYMNKMTEKEDTMWACKENIIDKLDNKIIYLNDEVEIISDEEEFEDIEEFKEHKIINTRDILELEMIINKINADYNYKINALIKNQKILIEKIKENKKTS